MPVRTSVKTQSKPLNINQEAPGQIVPYRPPSSPQIISPVPRGTLSAPPPSLPSPSSSPDIIDAEIIPPPSRPNTPPSPNTRPRRPVVSRDGTPSPEVSRPQYYPQYPNPADNWRTLADYAAWKNGMNRAQIDEEAEAYEFTKNWGREGGMLYPYTENGPRIPIISENFDRANRYRARNGLPSIDRFGYEKAQPVNPGLQPGSAFSPNPFGIQPETIFRPNSTPSNFDSPAYDYSRDPETGEPYTDLQRQRGDELGRPPWHINPTTGNPWGSDDPGTPVPNPFEGYPGGAVRFPAPSYEETIIAENYTFKADYGPGIPAWYEPWTASVTLPPGLSLSQQSGPGAGQTSAFIGGERVAVWGDQTTDGMTPTFRLVSRSPIISYEPVSGGDVIATPAPAPNANPNTRPNARPNARPLPTPVQDPRINPSPLPSLPYAPTPAPNTNPNTLPQRQPQYPSPSPSPLPNIPGSPYPPYAPTPFPRTSPTGTPQPSFDPSTQPTSSHPQNPRPYTQTDRPKNPPVNSVPGSPNFCDCPDPCPPDEVVTIQYLEFASCQYEESGEPNFYNIKEIKVPKSHAESLKILLDNAAKTQALECAPCCEWILEQNPSETLFEGYPPLSGLNVLLPRGCNSFVIEFNAVEAVADKSLRNMRRMTNPITNETTFINTAVVYVINANGNAIHSQELWVPRWEFIIPLHYREERMTVRLMSKTSNVNFKLIDSGRKWVSVVT